MKLGDFIENRGIWMLPFGSASFVFGLMLLVAGQLPEPVRQWTIPSLAVYLIGLGNIIFLKELFHMRYNHRLKNSGQEPGNLPIGQLWVFIALNLLLLVALVSYNVWKGVF